MLFHQCERILNFMIVCNTRCAEQKAQDRENRKEKARKAETKAKASRALPKTATGKRAGQKMVTNILMGGLGKMTNKLMGGGKRQTGRQNLVQDGGRRQTIGHHGNQKKQWVKLRSTAWKNARATRASQDLIPEPGPALTDALQSATEPHDGHGSLATSDIHEDR